MQKFKFDSDYCFQHKRTVCLGCSTPHQSCLSCLEHQVGSWQISGSTSQAHTHRKQGRRQLWKCWLLTPVKSEKCWALLGASSYCFFSLWNITAPTALSYNESLFKSIHYDYYALFSITQHWGQQSHLRSHFRKKKRAQLLRSKIIWGLHWDQRWQCVQKRIALLSRFCRDKLNVRFKDERSSITNKQVNMNRRGSQSEALEHLSVLHAMCPKADVRVCLCAGAVFVSCLCRLYSAWVFFWLFGYVQVILT